MVTQLRDPVEQPVARRRLTPRLELALLLGLLLAAGAAISLAMRQTSTTFDEIVMIAGGARGYETGQWTIAPEHPPLTQYLYGLPVSLTRPALPDETRVPPTFSASRGYRYWYAQEFFWRSGNDPERIAWLGRIPAVLMALLLVAVTYGIARSLGAGAAGLLAATLVAFTPDVLAHGGVAYNDIPVALLMLSALWAVDGALRNPTMTHGAASGALIALALAAKNSAVALAPMIVVLMLMELAARWKDTAWRRAVAVAAAVTLATIYLGLVIVYRGDVTLEEYRHSLEFATGHVTGSVPAWLLGERSTSGFWYFFPMAFLFKTSAAYHLLIVIAAGTWLYERRRGREQWRTLLTTPLRAPLVGLVVFLALLLRADLNIGFRYALPLLPMLAVLVAVGVVRAWQVVRTPVRVLIVLATAWCILHPLTYHPHYLTYISEYGPGRDQNYRVLVDSSLDWGQGLLALREFMEEEGIDRVQLSYFGSALPGGYGIDYVALPSFFPLRPGAAWNPDAPPQWLAVSATNLAGVYLPTDPYRALRAVRPDHVVANSIYLFRLAP